MSRAHKHLWSEQGKTLNLSSWNNIQKDIKIEKKEGISTTRTGNRIVAHQIIKTSDLVEKNHWIDLKEREVPDYIETKGAGWGE